MKFDDWLQALVTAAVASLFVNGSGQQAARLVLVDEDGRDIGGWGLEAAQDHVVRMMREGAE